MATLVCSSFVFMSCDDDDDKFTPESIVTKAFDTKYPDAQRVSWENEAGYVKAEFYTGSYEAEAWFDPQGNWMPQTVKNSFEASLYAKWKIDDVDMLERPDAGTIYVLDVENGEQDADLHYTEGGILIKEVTDGNGDNEHRPSVTPSAIKELISEMYPGATILEIDTETKGIEVDILHENIHKEVWLDTQNKWLYTEWEIRSSQVPDIVMTAFKASAYASYQIDDIHVIQKAEGLSYEFELEQGDRDITILFNEEGILVSPTHPLKKDSLSQYYCNPRAILPQPPCSSTAKKPLELYRSGQIRKELLKMIFLPRIDFRFTEIRLYFLTSLLAQILRSRINGGQSLIIRTQSILN